MSNILPIDNSIVPADVTKGYLSKFSEKEQQAIAALYEKIEAQAFEKVKGTLKSSCPIFVLVAGSQGVGKTHLVERLQKDRKGVFVECDVDSILAQMPEVKKAIEKAERELGQDFEMAGTAHYDANTHRTRVEAAVEKYRPAAKYISDRLMSTCLKNGINVIVETNAKTPKIGAFIDNVKKMGVILEGHICDAPLSVKTKGAKSPQHDFSFPEDVLKAESDALRKNIPVIAAACDQNLTVWWRQEAIARLQPAAVATSDSYTTDLIAKTGFEAYFADLNGMKIADLMVKRMHYAPNQNIETKLVPTMA